MEDYAASARAVRDVVPNLNHSQLGDPVKTATAILPLANADAPPLRAQLGCSCLEELNHKITQLRSESDVLGHLAVSTDHDDDKKNQAHGTNIFRTLATTAIVSAKTVATPQTGFTQ